jgi:predicted heme/steroid binding protein
MNGSDDTIETPTQDTDNGNETQLPSDDDAMDTITDDTSDGDDTTDNGDDDTSDDTASDTQDEEPEELLLTLQELADFDGRSGRRGLIAVDGIIYDVSNSSLWPNGLHRGIHQAGQDLTAAMDQNPRHGREMLQRLPRVGRIIED